MPSLAAAQQRMLADHLRGRGIRSARVLQAMARVPRERFLPPELAEMAYDDRALAIDCGQTISQPYIVAAMTEALHLAGGEHVLEIGTGSGYQTAVLAELARDVVSIERHEPLSRQAGERLAALGYKNVQLIVGDGALGWQAEAPYDAILAAAATAEVPPPLFEQLGEGGRMVLPVGDESSQVLYLIRKHNGRAQRIGMFGVRFVPFVSDAVG